MYEPALPKVHKQKIAFLFLQQPLPGHYLCSNVTSLTVSHTGFTEHMIIKGGCGDCRFPVFWGLCMGGILDQQWGVK